MAKAPIVVIVSADLKLAGNIIVFGALLQAGQIYMSSGQAIVIGSSANHSIQELQEIAWQKFSETFTSAYLTCRPWTHYPSGTLWNGEQDLRGTDESSG